MSICKWGFSWWWCSTHLPRAPTPCPEKGQLFHFEEITRLTSSSESSTRLTHFIDDQRTSTNLNMPLLSPWYAFAFVPQNAIVLELTESTLAPTQSSYSYSFCKGAAALLQAVYAFLTLYNSCGNQINWYGYAAFGLTVVPYAVMSVLNLIANIVTPSYSTLYLVESEVMKEAEQRKKELRFSNVVGRIKPVDDLSNNEDTIGGGQTQAGHCNAVGYFTDDVLRVRLPSCSSPATKQNEDLQVLTSSPSTSRYLSLYVPACPRFHRTDNIHETMYENLNSSPPPRKQRRRPSKQDDTDLLSYNDLPRSAMASNFGLRNSDLSAREESRSRAYAASNFIFLAVCGIEIAIIGGLSGFRAGESTYAQRVWTMTWFAFSCMSGYMIHTLELFMPITMSPDWLVRSLFKAAYIFLYCAPSIGGFVVVGQMLKEYGSCIRLNWAVGPLWWWNYKADF